MYTNRQKNTDRSAIFTEAPQTVFLFEQGFKLLGIFYGCVNAQNLLALM